MQLVLNIGFLGCSSAAPMAHMPVAQPTQAAPPDPKRSNPAEQARSLERVARSAEVLEDVPDETLRRATIQVLLDLAQAVEPRSSKEAAKIRECAERIERAATPAELDFTAVKEGLMATWRALDQGAPNASRPHEYEAALATLRGATEALSAEPGAPNVQLRASAASAFRAASDALALALGGEPTFAESDSPVQEREPARSPEAQLEEARAEVLKLGQTRWVNAPLAAAQALQALADLIEAQPGQRARAAIAEIRFNAELLRRRETSKFGSAGWIKTALTSTLDALDSLEAGREKLVSPWTRAARRAVAGIEDRDSLSFQRAAVQDAFRATVDAFVFAMQSAR